MLFNCKNFMLPLSLSLFLCVWVCHSSYWSPRVERNHTKHTHTDSHIDTLVTVHLVQLYNTFSTAHPCYTDTLNRHFRHVYDDSWYNWLPLVTGVIFSLLFTWTIVTFSTTSLSCVTLCVAVLLPPPETDVLCNINAHVAHTHVTRISLGSSAARRYLLPHLNWSVLCWKRWKGQTFALLFSREHV